MYNQMEDWLKVAYYLFKGIKADIEFYQEHFNFLTEDKMKEIEEVFEVYERRCLVSSAHLKKDVENLRKEFNERGVLYEY